MDWSQRKIEVFIFLVSSLSQHGPVLLWPPSHWVREPIPFRPRGGHSLSGVLVPACLIAPSSLNPTCMSMSHPFENSLHLKPVRHTTHCLLGL